MITEDRLAKALTYLATTDEDVAQLLVDMERAEYKAEAIRDTIFLHLEGSVADRQAKAKTATEYAAAKDAEFAARLKFKAMENKRKTENVVIDAWRSLNKAKSQGNI